MEISDSIIAKRLPLPKFLPGGALVRRLEYPVEIEKENICICMFQSISGKLSKNCTTHVFNHVVADFGKFDFVVEKVSSLGDMDMPDMEYGHTIFENWVEHFCSEDEFLWSFYVVKVTEMEKVLGSFNHASCQCLFPEFRVDELVSLSNYPMLEKVITVVAKRKIDLEEIYIFTFYAGIAAL